MTSATVQAPGNLQNTAFEECSNENALGWISMVYANKYDASSSSNDFRLKNVSFCRIEIGLYEMWRVRILGKHVPCGPRNFKFAILLRDISKTVIFDGLCIIFGQYMYLLVILFMLKFNVCTR